MNVRIPPVLKPGDPVYLLSTARALSAEQADGLVAAVKAAGYRPVVGASLKARHHIFAGDDTLRTADLQRALDDPDIRAIWCGRGGYGTTRLLDAIDWRGFLVHPKWIIGFSDVTALLAQTVRHGIAAIHGPLGIFAQSADGAAAWQDTLDLLSGKWPQYSWPAGTGQITGQASGTLIGGKLSLLSHLVGSPGEFPWEDSLLFLEDVDEYLYQIDRLLLQLHRSGRLAGIRGVVAGTFSDIHDNPEPFGLTLHEILHRAFAPYHIPLALDFPAGHVTDNRPLPLGIPAQLAVTATGCRLSFQP
ncbi:MAG: LD-carboxypeptidase [Bacteroidetes bacterium]|nr:LD-carboxypeptidase [Bacteroidota bacterium]